MRRHRSDSVRITTASRPHSEELRSRERRYLISMGIRTVCFLLAVVFIGHWVMWVFMAASLLLPPVAVIIANAGASPDPGGSEYDYDPGRPAITERPDEP